MAGKGSSSVAPARSTLRVFATALRSATCEWLLILLLLLDGIFAYLLTEFSRYCHLQVPCLFCSRIDHMLGNERPGYYYRNLICTTHQAEMSCLIYCHSHGKLVDGRAMCDDCLVSFSTMHGPNSEVQRAVAGKLGHDLGSHGSFTSKELLADSVATKVCSCCGKPWRSRHRADRLLRLNSPRSGILKASSIPLPHGLSRQESLKKIREKYSGSLTPCRLGNSGFASLSNVGYSELKFNSDSESEFHYSDDDDVYHNYKHHHMDETPKKEQPKTPATAEMDLHPFKQGMSADSWRDHGEGESVVHDENRVHIPAIPEIIPLDNLPPRNFSEIPHVLSIQIREQDDPSVLSADESCVLSELVALVDSPPVPTEQFEESKMKGLDGTILDDLNNKQTEVFQPVVDKAAGGSQVAPDVPSTYIIPLQHNETPKASFNIQEREAPQFMEQQQEEEHVMEEEHGNYDAPEVHHDSDMKMTNGSSSSRGIQTPPEPAARERFNNDSALESMVNEIEGESVEDRLRRQIELDRILISTLTQELDEERSASAIATNEAMAMITRLQAEKSALHMEALQYLRMMEEQAEYDGEEMEKTNDLLAEREKELQDLEAELDYFRMKYPEEDEEEKDHSNFMSNTSRNHNNMDMVEEEEDDADW
ncbi:Probable myosin-binding protein 4 [Linum perenne]